MSKGLTRDNLIHRLTVLRDLPKGAPAPEWMKDGQWDDAIREICEAALELIKELEDDLCYGATAYADEVT